VNTMIEVVERFNRDELIFIPKDDVNPSLAYNPFVIPTIGMVREDGAVLGYGKHGELVWKTQSGTESLRDSNRRNANWIRLFDQNDDIQTWIVTSLVNLKILPKGTWEYDDGIRVLKKMIAKGRRTHFLTLKYLDEDWLDISKGPWELVQATEDGVEIWNLGDCYLATSDVPRVGFFIVGHWCDGYGWAVGLPRIPVLQDLSWWFAMVRGIA